MAETARKVLLFVMIIGLCFLCSGCSLFDEYKEKILELELKIDSLNEEIDALEEEALYFNVTIPEIRGCIEEFLAYNDGAYDRFMDEEEAFGYLYYAIDMCRDLEN